jgi:hypothetical protein
MRRIDIEGLEKRNLLLLKPEEAEKAVETAQRIRHEMTKEQIIVIACRLLNW